MHQPIDLIFYIVYQLSYIRQLNKWHDKITDYTPGALSDYVLLAVKENMVRDGII